MWWWLLGITIKPPSCLLHEPNLLSSHHCSQAVLPSSYSHARTNPDHCETYLDLCNKPSPLDTSTRRRRCRLLRGQPMEHRSKLDLMSKTKSLCFFPFFNHRYYKIWLPLQYFFRRGGHDGVAEREMKGRREKGSTRPKKN